MLATELIVACEVRQGRPGVKRGHNTRVLCPAHDDHTPSLDIAAAADGSALVVCRSHGCSYLQILEALGMEPQADNGSWTPEGPGTAIAHYPYQDEEGQLLYEVVRTDSKQFPQRRPDPTSKTGYRWKLGDVRRVLYHLPEVVKAVAASQTIWVAEGEKDADRLRKLGLVATTSPGGAGKWKEDYAQSLRGATVSVVADLDEPGLAHAAQVAQSLQHVGCLVTVLKPAHGKDVSDHLAAGLTLDQLEPLTSLELPEPEGPLRFQVRTAPQLMAIPDPDAGYQLLGSFVSRGYRTIIVGDTGHGKTTLAFQMLSAILTGSEALGETGAGVGPVLIVDLEQGIRSIKRGLAEANLEERDEVLLVTIPDGLALDQSSEEYAALEAVLADHHPAAVLLDPYYKAHRAEDPNQERPIIDLMRALDRLRAAYGFALILPAHPRKRDKAQVGARKLTLDDVAGSGAVTRGAEIILGIERLHPGKARLRWLKDRDGDSEVGEAIPLTYSKEGGFRLDTSSPDDPEALRDKILDGPVDKWLTTREWAAEVKTDHNRTKAMLESLATDPEEPIYFAKPAPGRHPSAQCYARCIEPPIHLNTPSLLAPDQAGVLGVSPLRGEEGNTPTPGPGRLTNTPQPDNPLD